MLDLGFREDLETLLQAAPATRRTLLLSATLPAEIRALARRYQRDALADRSAQGRAAAPRTPGKAAHDDITHRAHLVAGGRSPGRGGQRAARRRERAAPSSSARRARGSPTCTRPWSRAASRRRRSRAIAPRPSAIARSTSSGAATSACWSPPTWPPAGLHLPDVDLIVHADLPLNADSLIHRSGRTGRAGRKGTAVVIATAAERRKAERLLGARARQGGLDAAPVGRDDRRRGASAARRRAPGERGARRPKARQPASCCERLEGKLPRASCAPPARRASSRACRRASRCTRSRRRVRERGRADATRSRRPDRVAAPRAGEFSREADRSSA